MHISSISTPHYITTTYQHIKQEVKTSRKSGAGVGVKEVRNSVWGKLWIFLFNEKPELNGGALLSALQHNVHSIWFVIPGSWLLRSLSWRLFKQRNWATEDQTEFLSSVLLVGQLDEIIAGRVQAAPTDKLYVDSENCSDLFSPELSCHCCPMKNSAHLLWNKYIIKSSFLMEPWSGRTWYRCGNKFKFLHLINYSLLTGIDFLYFGSVDQVLEIFNRLVGLGTNTFYC